MADVTITLQPSLNLKMKGIILVLTEMFSVNLNIVYHVAPIHVNGIYPKRGHGIHKHQYVKEKKRLPRDHSDVRAPHHKKVSDSDWKCLYHHVKAVEHMTQKKRGLSFTLPNSVTQSNN